MALETLKEVTEIDGFPVVHQEGPGRKVLQDREFVEVDHDKNAITFKIQNGPIGENGVNGCQVDTMIIAAAEIIRGLNKKFPCRENSCAITHLDEALHWLKARKTDRVKRGVEGTDQV